MGASPIEQPYELCQFRRKLFSNHPGNDVVTHALVLAAGLQISGCPTTIDDTQMVAASSGWHVRTEKRPRLLERVAVYSGEPSHRRSLQPIPGKNGSSDWGFAGENIWIECRYSDSAAVLVKNLGVLKSCSFEPAEGGTGNPARVTCERDELPIALLHGPIAKEEST
jgi:hypothetical protein